MLQHRDVHLHGTPYRIPQILLLFILFIFLFFLLFQTRQYAARTKKYYYIFILFYFVLSYKYQQRINDVN